MSQPVGMSRAGAAGPVGAELAVRLTIFVAIGIAGVVAAVASDAWWTLAPALAGIAFAAAGALLTIARMMDRRPGGAAAQASGGRASAVALGLVAVALLVVAVVVPEHAATAIKPTPATRAVETVRGFLVASVVRDDGYEACQYLTPSAQQAVAQRAGTPTCRAAFDATQPSFPGVRGVLDADHLAARAVVHGDRAEVRVEPKGGAPATFALRRATPAELNAFRAPSDPWRIDSGEFAVLHA